MQTLRKKTSPCKYRNDPGRFFGDGVTFKAKLIGILEVGEARGDKMCQEALQDLKMAIRAAGEHKQRITIHVTIDGLRLRDEKTGDSLYHHPVHKISFIAQDMTDSRAFGYIFGSPDSGHRFFGIKTDKAASQVVLAMRDLFQVVFELKKKEIELARQQIQSKTIHEHQTSSALPSLLIKSTSSDTHNLAIKNSYDGAKANITKDSHLMSPESVADLVDLEQELSSIQRGITQLDRITPNEPTAPLASIDSTLEDPFGDSFTNFGSGSGTKTYNLLPPPESSRSRHSKPVKPPETIISTMASSINSVTTTLSSSPTARTYPYSYTNNISSNSNANTANITTNTHQESENWLNDIEKSDVFNESGISSKSIESNSTSTITGIAQTSITAATEITTSNITTNINEENSSSQQQKTGEGKIKLQQLYPCGGTKSLIDNQSLYTDVFTDLDPLGTGKSRPYVDKKYFFHELKNPPKKVLKDLSGANAVSSLDSQGFTFTGRNNADSCNNDMDDLFDRSESYELSGTSTMISGCTKDIINSSFNQTSLFQKPIHFNTNQIHNNLNKNFHIDLERKIDATSSSPTVMLPRDTDPFSPTRKKSDPFQEGDIFSKLDPFEFEFAKSKILTDTKITTIDSDKLRKESTTSPSVFNGPLQVQLPPESSWSAATCASNSTMYPDPTYSSQRGRIERQSSESPTSTSRNRPSVFKQNTVDVISSISSKKMPHLFGQKFTKRDSNSINMRRLQESDSLSENETAPEPPPRPDTTGLHHIEPPPLPPKKQFSDIVIRPRITSSSAIQPPPTRYDYVTAKMKSSQLSMDSSGSAPPIPLPSRRVGRTDSSYPGPGRPRKPGCEDEDYLAPLGGRGDVPPLLPPPQTKSRSSRRQESIDNKITAKAMAIEPISLEKPEPELILPDITLSQLLTLGIDDLAGKLNVSPMKLNTMTIVELTSYLSEFLERSKKPKSAKNLSNTIKSNVEHSSPIFKVSFDQNSEAAFVAKFDDNFGEDTPNSSFVANFSQFDIKPEPQSTLNENINSKPIIVPSADRYAVFREIIDQEIMNDSLETDEDEENYDNASPVQQKLADLSDEDETKVVDLSISQIAKIPKIDTKITEAISHAKDRYAALRDIILVKDLFENPTSDNNFGEEIAEKFVEEFPSTINTIELNNDDENSSPDSNQNYSDLKIDELVSTETKENKNTDNKHNSGTLFTLTVSSTNNKDDLEIDELMNRAISNLSLDSRDHLSPNNQSKSPTVKDGIQSDMSPTMQSLQQPFRKSPLSNPVVGKSQFNDVSTSPIPIQQPKSPGCLSQPMKSPSKSPINKSPLTRSPIPQTAAVANLIALNGTSPSTKLNNSGSLSDMVCGSSPDLEKQQQQVPAVNSESWAIFDKPNEKKEKHLILQQGQRLKSPKGPSLSSSSNNKDLIAESPCSSDGKDDWKVTGGIGGVVGSGGVVSGNGRWPKGQTSSSSRDLSPWDDEADYKKRVPPSQGNVAPDRHGYYMRHSKRMNSCDDDYDYEDEIAKRRDRKLKGGMSRSRENFEFDAPNWYHMSNWSPQDEEERARALYERSNYSQSRGGDHKISPHSAYDRRGIDYKGGYDKRKYYREYSRPPADYDFESYGESPDVKDRKMMYSRRDYENIYEDGNGFVRGGGGSGIYKSREYFYGGGSSERRSFDRESIESYESAGRRRKSFGSGDVYGSFDSREEFRERYLGGEKSRSLRMAGFKKRGSTGGDEYEQDSENDVQMRRSACGDHTRSLQRPVSGSRIRKSSGSSPWDGEEPPAGNVSKGWKRPSSASESSDRRLAADNCRVLSHTSGGSDGEKDRRFRKKQRSRTKEGNDQRPGISNLPPPGVGRYPIGHRGENYDYVYNDYDPSQGPAPTKLDEDKFERLNRRRQDMRQRMLEAERRKRTESTSGEKYSYDDEDDDSSTLQKYPIAKPNTVGVVSGGGGNKKEVFYSTDKDRYGRGKFESFEQSPQSSQQKTPVSGKSLRSDFDFQDFEETPRSNASSSGGKFQYEEHGFESDFNSSPPQQEQPQANISQSKISSTTVGGKVATKSSFRFSNDFSSEKHHHQNFPKHSTSSTNYDGEFSPTVVPTTQANLITPTTTPLQKLRFDDKVTISKFDNNEPSSCAFDDDDDDFSKAQFDFENEDQWNPNDQPKKNNMRHAGNANNVANKQYRQQQTGQHEFIRKSESVNIFAKKSDDPFEDDDFFNSSTNDGKRNGNNGNNGNKSHNKTESFQWDNNFAKFDENM